MKVDSLFNGYHSNYPVAQGKYTDICKQREREKERGWRGWWGEREREYYDLENTKILFNPEMVPL